MLRRVPWWVGPAAFALLLRVAGAVLLQPWHDEYFTAWVVHGTLKHLLEALRWDAGPPLPYLLAKLFALPGLPPLVAARAVSVICGVLAPVLLGAAVRKTCSLKAGVSAGWLLAVHPLAVMWSSEGRAYGLLSLAVAGSLWALAQDQGTAQPWYWLAGFLTLGLYTHPLGLLWLLAVTSFALYHRRPRELWACGLAMVLFLPWLPVMTSQPADAVAWMGNLGRKLPHGAKFLGPLRLLPPVAGWGYTLEAPIPAWFFQVLAGVATVLAVVGARGFWLLFLAPTGLLAGAWAAGLPVFFPGRGEALILAPFLGLLGCGLVRWVKLARAGFVALGLVSSVAILHYWQTRPSRPEIQIARLLRAKAAQGILVTTGWWWLSMRHWLPPTWQVVHLPAAALRHPGWFVPEKEKAGPEELQAIEGLLLDRHRTQAKAVLVTSGLPETEILQQTLRKIGFSPMLKVPSGVVYWRSGGDP